MVRALARIGPIGLIVAVLIAGDSWRSVEPAHACGAFGPYDFDAWEAESYISTYNQVIDAAVEGKAVTSAVTVGDEVVDMRFAGLASGPRTARQPVNPAFRIPPSIFKSIAYVEADWSMAAGDVPFGGVGKTLRSFDCGYGMSQATSSMYNDTGQVTARQALIGTDVRYNIAEGVRILADKWNNGGPIAGNGDPNMLEDWYFAIWRYNGFAFVNHPLNPVFDPLRGGIPPVAPPPPPGPSVSPSPSRSPSPSPANSLTPTPTNTPTTPTPTPTPTLQPNTPIVSPVWHCADPAAASFQATANGTAKFSRGDYTYPEKVYGCMRNPPKKLAGQPMWPPQTFNMPDFTNPAVARAFAPENYQACVNPCASMDYPTSYVSPVTGLPVITHTDTTPRANPAASPFLSASAPVLKVEAPATMNLLVYGDGTSGYASFVVKNAGSWIAPFRIRTTAPWLMVRHINDPTDRSLDAGVAIGANVDVLLEKSGGPRLKGYDSNLIVAIDASNLPSGAQSAVLYIDSLLGPPVSVPIQISVTRSDQPIPLPFKVRAPGIAAGR